MSDLLSCVEIEPAGPTRASVVWLHGLGADGHDFEPIVPHLGVDDLGIRFVFPHAPRRGVTINMGLLMPAWYDIRDLGFRRDYDARGVRESCEQVSALLAGEVSRGIPTQRIVLAGFSQGGAIALHLGLRYRETLAGIVGLSTYLLDPEGADTEAAEANRETPILLAHGTHDPMVPFAAGRAARDRLVELGRDVRWHEYRMEHQVVLEEIEVVGGFLRERLGGGSAGQSIGTRTDTAPRKSPDA